MTMTDFLDDWVRILGARLPYNATQTEKQLAVAAKLKLRGQIPSVSGLRVLMQDLLGDVFLEIHVHEKDFDGYLSTYPVDVEQPGGQGVGIGPWQSGLCFFSIETYKPVGMGYPEFLSIVSQIFPLLRDYLPGWCGYDWYLITDGYEGFILNSSLLGLDAL
jgi:hypothetical protein